MNTLLISHIRVAIAALALIASVAVSGQTKSELVATNTGTVTKSAAAETTEEAIRKELIDLNEAVRRRDTAAVLSHYSEEEGFFYERDSGRFNAARNKTEWRDFIEYMAKSGAVDVFELKDLAVLTLSADTALANYVLVLKRTTDGTTKTIREAATDVFVLRNGRWLIRAEHSEMLPKIVEPVIAGLPVDWQRAPGGSSDSYAMTVDTTVHHTGKASASIKFLCSSDSEPWASLSQEVDATKFAGKRVRLTGWLKTADVGEGSIWMRADGVGRLLAFDNMSGRTVKGTTEWKRYEVVLDIPDTAVNLVFGALVLGKGQAWYDDFAVEVVGSDVPVTAPNQELESTRDLKRSTRSVPVNLGFENGAIK